MNFKPNIEPKLIKLNPEDKFVLCEKKRGIKKINKEIKKIETLKANGRILAYSGPTSTISNISTFIIIN